MPVTIRLKVNTYKLPVFNFLPPYAPNLIERYWKFFKKTVGTDYETVDRFKSACDAFFNQACDHVELLRSLLAENFQLMAIPETEF